MTSYFAFLFLIQYLPYAIKGQVIYVSTERSWHDAETDCQERGSHLLTATVANRNTQNCISQATTSTIWVGLNRISDGFTWTWSSSVIYDVDAVTWSKNNPRTGNSDGDCARMKITGNGIETLRNQATQCSDIRPYCCDPVSLQSSTTTTTAPPHASIPSALPTNQPVQTTTGECGPRIRKEWNTVSQEERDLYIYGMLELSQRGILQIFTEQHAEQFAEDQAHGTSAFLPWHRLFIKSLEDAIRSLGGVYQCFSLFYWNWALDASTYGQNYAEYIILNSGLGSSGDKRDNYCVTDGAFAKGNYKPFYCENNWLSSDGLCCLRRRTARQNSGNIHTNSEMANIISSDNIYGSDKDDNTDGFRENIELVPHAEAHCSIGTCGDSGGHLGHGFYSPDDPIFYLLHTYVDMIWAIWQDTNDYDLIHKSQITNVIYDGTTAQRSHVDDILIFDVLMSQGYYWSSLTGNERIRDVHNIEDLNVQYEKGSFFNDANIDESNINSNWFVDNSVRQQRRIMDETSIAKQFEQSVYIQLVNKYGEEYVLTKQGRKEIVGAWAKMQCEYKNAVDRECERPHYFDDCSDMELSENQYGKIDIVINLDELIGKVYDYPCMVETRERFYEWTKGFGLLKNLCRGEFDRFCGKQFLVGKKQYKCVERIDHENENLYYYIE